MRRSSSVPGVLAHKILMGTLGAVLVAGGFLLSGFLGAQGSCNTPNGYCISPPGLQLLLAGASAGIGTLGLVILMRLIVKTRASGPGNSSNLGYIVSSSQAGSFFSTTGQE